MSDGAPVRAVVAAARWTLTLYVSGASPRSTEAIATLRKICDQDLAGNVDLEILNAADHPRRLVEDQIVAVPTLVKHAPAPLRHLVGNLSDLARVRSGLDLATQPAPAARQDLSRKSDNP